MKKIIRKFIYNICAEASSQSEYKISKQQLDHTSDLAKLIIDCKNNNLSIQSRKFICRMNIHPDEFKTK